MSLKKFFSFHRIRFISEIFIVNQFERFPVFGGFYFTGIVFRQPSIEIVSKTNISLIIFIAFKDINGKHI